LGRKQHPNSLRKDLVRLHSKYIEIGYIEIVTVAEQGEKVGARAPGRRSWERINTLYSAIKKAFLSRNVVQIGLKMRIFWKSFKIAAVSGIDPKTPLASGGWVSDPDLRVVTPAH